MHYFSFRFNKGMMSDTGAISSMVNGRIKEAKNFTELDHRKFILDSVRFYDQDADNFTKNLVTTVIYFHRYKSPRIAFKRKQRRLFTEKRLQRFWRICSKRKDIVA